MRRVLHRWSKQGWKLRKLTELAKDIVGQPRVVLYVSRAITKHGYKRPYQAMAEAEAEIPGLDLSLIISSVLFPSLGNRSLCFVVFDSNITFGYLAVGIRVALTVMSRRSIPSLKNITSRILHNDHKDTGPSVRAFAPSPSLSISSSPLLSGVPIFPIHPPKNPVWTVRQK